MNMNAAFIQEGERAYMATQSRSGLGGLGPSGDPVAVEDTLDVAYVAEHGTQVRRVGHLEREARQRDPVACRVDGRRKDVDVLVGQCPRHVRQQAGSVEGLDLDLDE